MTAGILLLHGLRLFPLWNGLLAHDLRRDGHHPVHNWGYRRIGEGLSQVVEEVEERLCRQYPGGVPPLDLVGHSMGGLVARKLLLDGVVPPGGRLVTIGSPHYGAAKAERFGDLWLFRRFFGQCGQDLRPGSRFLMDLPDGAPTQSLSVVSGRGKSRGFSRFVPGDNDGVVETGSQRLRGAEVFFCRGVLHTMQPLHPRVRRVVRRFLLREELPASDPCPRGY